MHEPFLVRLPKGEDLLDCMTREFRNRGVRKAGFNLIGALKRCVLAYYDLDARQYRNREFPFHSEIVSCMGNVSEKDGDVFVHAHLILAGDDFACFGGHLMAGSEIFAAELFAVPVTGDPLVRAYDKPTGLALWK